MLGGGNNFSVMENKLGLERKVTHSIRSTPFRQQTEAIPKRPQARPPQKLRSELVPGQDSSNNVRDTIFGVTLTPSPPVALL